MERRSPKAGQYSFDGSCRPDAFAKRWRTQKTFSVGVFMWVEKAGGRGLKRGPVVVRVSGSVDDDARVLKAARAVVRALQAGTYDGPKHVRVHGKKGGGT